MAKGKLLIGCAITAVAIIVVVLAVIAGGFWLMGSRNKKATLVHTEVGKPKGSAITKTIGAEGGSISSPDGRITIEIPPQAVSSSTSFSIQPITNMVPGGLGDAYRLEPNGRTFSAPLKLAFKFKDEDIDGSALEGLRVSYQDDAGVWQSLTDAVIDRLNHTYTITTRHFTDYAIRKGIEIRPPHQILRPGQSTYLEVVGCDEAESLAQRAYRLIGEKHDEDCGDLKLEYDWANKLYWKTDHGTIETGKRRVKFTATGGTSYVATITMPFEYFGGVFVSSGTPGEKGSLRATITVSSPYQASGQNGPVTYSGTICDLGAPFKVTVTNSPFSYEINFVPSENNQVPLPKNKKHGETYPHYDPYTTGTFSYSMTSGMLQMSGQGYYTLDGEKTDHPVINCYQNSEAHGPMGIGSSGRGAATIQLTPLESSECNGK